MAKMKEVFDWGESDDYCGASSDKDTSFSIMNGDTIVIRDTYPNGDASEMTGKIREINIMDGVIFIDREPFGGAELHIKEGEIWTILSHVNFKIRLAAYLDYVGTSINPIYLIIKTASVLIAGIKKAFDKLCSDTN